MTEQKKSKVAQHFTDYRDMYIVGMVGVVSASALFKIKTIDISNVETITAAGIGLAKTVNNIDNSVNIIGNGHAGKVVEAILSDGTRVTVNSVSKAAEMFDIPRSTLQKLIKTGESDALGRTFSIIGNALSNDI